MGLLLQLLIFAVFSLASRQSRAYEIEFVRGYSTPETAAEEASAEEEKEDQEEAEARQNKNPKDGSFYKKYSTVLNALKIPPEPEVDFSDFPKGKNLSLAEIKTNLEWIDPKKALRRYLLIDKNTITLYLDHYGRKLPDSYEDFSITVKDQPKSSDSESLIDTLDQITQNSLDAENDAPLKGLRVMIDPGHMGNAKANVPELSVDTWDVMTGKYVDLKKNGYVSEGNLNLWTAFLVANELESLGAEVKLTRTELKPVIDVSYANFDPSLFIHQFFYNGFDDWMVKYFEPGFKDSMVSSLKNDVFAKSIFDQAHRQSLYTEAADLDARVKAAAEYQPDIFLDIHYDAQDEHHIQGEHGKNGVSGYVPGNYFLKETGSRRTRALALKHLLEARRWTESTLLVASLTKAMGSSLKIDVERDLDIGGAHLIKKEVPGVYTRNLYIPRRLRTGLIAYLECLHYDHPDEFFKLTHEDTQGTYHGIRFKYPKRLKSVASGIKLGLLNYFRTRYLANDEEKD